MTEAEALKQAMALWDKIENLVEYLAPEATPEEKFSATKLLVEDVLKMKRERLQ